MGLDQQVDIDISSVTWPSSVEVKVAVATLLRSAVMPNWHSKVAKWDESVKNKRWSKRVPDELWCEPRAEDETETDEDSESEGE